MNIIGFSASPHKAGSTAWAVDTILEGAREQGAETQAWHSCDLDIKPCRGCLGCVKGGGCVINDDMQKLYDALKRADALVLGSTHRKNMGGHESVHPVRVAGCERQVSVYLEYVSMLLLNSI